MTVLMELSRLAPTLNQYTVVLLDTAQI